eukprot:scaffold148_cov341-Pavlova_lutheri.AAC.27
MDRPIIFNRLRTPERIRTRRFRREELKGKFSFGEGMERILMESGFGQRGWLKVGEGTLPCMQGDDGGSQRSHKRIQGHLAYSGTREESVLKSSVETAVEHRFSRHVQRPVSSLSYPSFHESSKNKFAKFASKYTSFLETYPSTSETQCRFVWGHLQEVSSKERTLLTVGILRAISRPTY